MYRDKLRCTAEAGIATGESGQSFSRTFASSWNRRRPRFDESSFRVVSVDVVKQKNEEEKRHPENIREHSKLHVGDHLSKHRTR